MKTLMDRDFKYTSAEDSRKPGYLGHKFAEIKRKLQRDSQPSNVTTIVTKRERAK